MVDDENFIQIKDLSNHNRIKNIFEKAEFDMSKKTKMQFTLMKVVRDKVESITGKRGKSAQTYLPDSSGTKIRKLNIDEKKLIAQSNKEEMKDSERA